MALKRRRRRSGNSRRRYREPTIWEQFDWHLDIKISKEILALILFSLGLVFILAIFNLAGPVGAFFLKLFTRLWGFYGYIFPLAFLILGINLFRFREEEMLRGSITIGVIGSFLTVPAIAPRIGGQLGTLVSHLFTSFLGTAGGTVVLLILSVIFLMIAFNTNIGGLLQRWREAGEGDEQSDEQLSPKVKINEPRAPVFVAGRKPQPGAPPSPQQPSIFSATGENWVFPPIDLLDYSTTKAESGNINKNVAIIEKTLREFSIDVTMSEVNVGPTVTQYTLKPTEGVKLNQITARANDIALSLAAKSLRMEAPIPGKSAVGIEIPNIKPATVTLREIIEDDSFSKAKSNLTLALGRDVAGQPFCVDLKSMPHLLIAGSTGSGKSVCINSIITALLYENSPADLRLILVDPKRVEFTEYNGIPHLLAPVVIDVDKTVNVLKWAVNEMDRRFKLFADIGRRNIQAYNDNPPDGQKLPYIILIIDELADLMAQAANEVEASIVRLAQMARAIGIHLIVATQRPSVDVITGLIKANMPTRIAFAVASQVDSRTILDQAGADKLLGKGDMLYLSSELGQPRRIQGVNVLDKEIKEITDFFKKEGSAVYDESVLNYKASRAGGIGGAGAEADDDLYDEAKEVVIQAGKASASLLQRRLRVGYARAARLLDLMEENGVIGPADGSKPRDILVDSYSTTGGNYSDTQY
ncbi:MAG: DNA translocase FtsK 4TM domain-containing protein [bacterium]|nr:DNA translocase FtsK 4TM domain-containing protein [bacterium]